MLSFPDRRQNFEQLRARWEAAETSKDTNMVGRWEKQTPHQTANEGLQHDAGSKFRRKLSHGLALISLRQRKLSSNVSLAVSASSTNNSSDAVLDHEALLLPQADFVSVGTSSDSRTSSQDTTRASEDLRTPKQLPRSRTFSYIPRPVKIDAEANSTAELDEPIEPSLDTAMADLSPPAPSRIPTPSPPQSNHRGSSPRQYLPRHPSLKARSAANRQLSTGVGNASPAKAAIRSRTTPNLLKTAGTTQVANYMAPRRPGIKRPFASSAIQKPVLAENVPTNKRVTQRQSYVQDRTLKSDSFSVQSTTSNRRSIGPGAPLPQSKRSSLAMSTTSTKRFSSQLAQTPVAARRVPPDGQEGANGSDSFRSPEEVSLAPRLMGPKSPPTPTPSSVSCIYQLSVPPPLSIDNGTPRRTLGTPNGLGGAWRSSKVFAAADHQVRRLPRSSTFHYFGRCREAPQVPHIPNQCKSPSAPSLIHPVLQQCISPSLPNLHHRFPTSERKFGSSARSLLSEIASTQRSSETELLKSSTDIAKKNLSKVDDSKREQRTAEEWEISRTQEVEGTIKHTPCDDSFQSNASSTTLNNITALPPVSTEMRFKPSQTLVLETHSKNATRDMSIRRCWSISERFYPNSTDNPSRVQVKDYMPPLYWAGRFQSRFDQWRTEAMVAVLNPEYKSEDEGPLGQCSLDDERKAKILIFMQLRDLCASAQAADSLQEFEYRYRKDHEMLDNKHDLPPSLRKPEESTRKGPIGRAVRKLTPRKASFADLFKGKGWNRNDNTKLMDMPQHVRELQELTDCSHGLCDTTDSDAAEFENWQHTR